MLRQTEKPYSVEFIKEGKVAVAERQTVLQAAIPAGIPIFHVCGGHAKCSTCRVLVIEGSEQLSAPTPKENCLNQKLHFPPHVRLACQTTVNGDGVKLRRIIQDEHDRGLYIGSSDGTSTQQIGEEKELVLFFLDIRNFTRFVETHLPFDVIHIIRKLFSIFQPVLYEYGGRIVETTGDGFYAVFGWEGTIQQSAGKAVQAALTIFHELEKLNADYFHLFFDEPIQVGIGIHAGTVVSGAVSVAEKEQIVVMGLPVNVASRLQNATKELNNSLIVSEAVRHFLLERFSGIPATRLFVKGVSEQLTVYLLGKPFFQVRE